MLKNVLVIGVGGMTGSILRYLLYLAFGNTAFPFTTLFINIAGCFAIGAITGYGTKNTQFADWHLFLATGLCGGFTTFSAFSVECMQLVQQNRNIAALSYALISMTFGITATFVAYIMTK